MTTTVTPYLSFNGNTREAFAFYEKALDAQIEAMMTFDDMPPPPPGDAGAPEFGMPTGNGIMHAGLRLPGGARLYAGDVPPGMPYSGITGIMIAIEYDSVDEARRVFDALAEGGNVTMPLAPAFWAKTFGMLTDRFGVAWAINGEPIDFA